MHRLTVCRLPFVLILSALACVAQAQPAATAGASAPATIEQRAESITHEDAGSRIDELRVGGQTRRIEVTTKSALPAYEIQPLDASLQDQSERGAGKSRWRLVDF